MKTLHKSVHFIDPTLTPQNAHSKGYTYIDDVIYDHQNPNDAMREILELINTEGYKLGTPDNPIYPDPYYGLYVPN